jgi:hypothetical protein
MEFRVDQTWGDPMNEESKGGFEFGVLWYVQKRCDSSDGSVLAHEKRVFTMERD